jgi:membrane protease YdiL (CAAX protease family)
MSQPVESNLPPDPAPEFFPPAPPLEAPRLPVAPALHANTNPFWLSPNAALACVLAVVLVLLLNVTLLRSLPPLQGAGENAADPTELNLKNIPPEVLATLPAIRIRMALVALSLAGLFAIFLGWNSAAYRERLRKYIARAPSRFQPAVTVGDFALTLLAWFFGSMLIGLVAGLVLNPDHRHSEVLLVSASMLAVGAAVVLMILLTRSRAGGAHGSYGLYPFWTLPRAAPPRPIWKDVVLALAMYVLTVGVLHVVALANSKLVQLAGHTEDQHSLITKMLQPQPWWVIAIFLVTATLGAALFEEIIFRGGLFNALRRIMGVWPAAFLTSLLFAAIHFLVSDFLALMVLSLLMTWLYVHTGRLVASMTFHFMNNLVSLLTVLSLRDYIT